MKFYYNGQLMRTSKNHNYTHAVVVETENGIKCRGCHKDRKGCEADINGAINRCYVGIENANEAIKALNAGKIGCYSKDGRKSWYFKFDSNDTVERYEKHIAACEAYIDKIRNTWKIVELEAR